MVKLLIYFLIFAVAGCAVINKYDGVMTLKRFGDEQKQIENYLKKQEALFYRLKSDIESNKLTKGITKRNILSTYGNPIFSRKLIDNEELREVLLYRHPTEYFSTDKVYLYFDEKQNLCLWKFEPAINIK